MKPFEDVPPQELQNTFDKFIKALDPQVIYDNEFKTEPGYTDLSERDKGMFAMLKVFEDMDTKLAFQAIKNMNQYVPRGILDTKMKEAYFRYPDLTEFQKGCFIMMLTTYANHIKESENDEGNGPDMPGMIVIVVGKGKPPFM